MNTKFIFMLFIVSLSHKGVKGQDSLKPKPIVTLVPGLKTADKAYHPFVFPTPKSTPFYNYPLTSNEIISRERGKQAYNRVYNTITNHNGDGIYSNLTGMQRIKPKHNKPGF